MLDRMIPYYNIICKCDRYCPVDAPLPLGLRIRTWQPGDAKAWARLEYTIGDFPSPEEAETYFVSHYLKQPKEAEKRCFFVVTERNEVIASCIAWRDRKGAQTVASLHWLVVAPEQQGKKKRQGTLPPCFGCLQQLGRISRIPAHPALELCCAASVSPPRFSSSKDRYFRPI